MKSNQFVAYLRVSTEGQGKSGLGLEAQRNAVQTFLPAGAVILSEFIEVESGKKADRPELAKAIALAKKTKSTLLIAKLDRLARNVAFIANLLDGDVDVVAADMPQANKFLLHIMAAVAEQEAVAISERTKAALQASKARGVKLGWANPRRKGEQRLASMQGHITSMVRADVFAALCRDMLTEAEQNGQTTFSGVAHYFNVRGLPTSRGGRWHASTVRNLANRLNVWAVGNA